MIRVVPLLLAIDDDLADFAMLDADHVAPPVARVLDSAPPTDFGMVQRQWLIGRPGTGERKVGSRGIASEPT